MAASHTGNLTIMYFRNINQQAEKTSWGKNNIVGYYTIKVGRQPVKVTVKRLQFTMQAACIFNGLPHVVCNKVASEAVLELQAQLNNRYNATFAN
jgi:hypothetical protein